MQDVTLSVSWTDLSRDYEQQYKLKYLARILDLNMQIWIQHKYSNTVEPMAYKQHPRATMGIP